MGLRRREWLGTIRIYYIGKIHCCRSSILRDSSGGSGEDMAELPRIDVKTGRQVTSEKLHLFLFRLCSKCRCDESSFLYKSSAEKIQAVPSASLVCCRSFTELENRDRQTPVLSFSFEFFVIQRII